MFLCLLYRVSFVLMPFILRQLCFYAFYIESVVFLGLLYRVSGVFRPLLEAEASRNDAMGLAGS